MSVNGRKADAYGNNCLWPLSTESGHTANYPVNREIRHQAGRIVTWYATQNLNRKQHPTVVTYTAKCKCYQEDFD
jgi:hypothetical protein